MRPLRFVLVGGVATTLIAFGCENADIVDAADDDTAQGGSGGGPGTGGFSSICGDQPHPSCPIFPEPSLCSTAYIDGRQVAVVMVWYDPFGEGCSCGYEQGEVCEHGCDPDRGECFDHGQGGAGGLGGQGGGCGEGGAAECY